MKLIKTQVVFHDQRGDIRPVIEDAPLNMVTHMVCTAGSVRGNHYHLATTHYDYILKGTFEVYTRMGMDGPVEKTVVHPGDIVMSPPGECRAFKALEDGEFLACMHGPSRANPEDFKKDTVQLSEPLVS